MTNPIATPCKVEQWYATNIRPYPMWRVVDVNGDYVSELFRDKTKADHLCLALNNFDDCVEALKDYLKDLTEGRVYIEDATAEQIAQYDAQVNKIRKVLDRIEKGVK